MLELSALAATVMAMGALSIDLMIPALGAMSDSFALNDPNDRQLVLVVYLAGLGAGQLLFGPPVDRFGRKPVLLACIGLYLVGTLGCALAPTFETLLVARVVQSLGGAGGRVAVMALVRDLTSGRSMAQVMSLASAMFLIAPIVAPSLGQLILFAAPWRGLFAVLAVFGAALGAWVLIRTPETLAEEQRQPLRLGAALRSYWAAMKPPAARGYALALALGLGALFAFISSAEQVFTEVFKLGPSFTLIFACIAGTAATATLLNAALVKRMGMRRLSHGATIALLSVNACHIVLITLGLETIVVFAALMAATAFSLALMASNFQALAMEPLGKIAGAGAATVGFISTFGGAAIGGAIGRFYDGTPGPLVWGMTLAAAGALVIVAITERGRLFAVGAVAPVEPTTKTRVEEL